MSDVGPSISPVLFSHKELRHFEIRKFIKSQQHTAHQIDLEVCFAITMTFFIENVSLDFTKSNEKVRKKICNALFKKIDFFHF